MEEIILEDITLEESFFQNLYVLGMKDLIELSLSLLMLLNGVITR